MSRDQLQEHQGKTENGQRQTPKTRIRPTTPHVKPSLKPQKIKANAWYYEGRGSIQVLVFKEGVTTCCSIPWWKIMRSARRCGWKVPPK